jgi:fumarate hydratase class II
MRAFWSTGLPIARRCWRSWWRRCRRGAAVIAEIARRTGLPFREARNHFEAQASKDAIVFLSGALRTYAVALTKIANDVRWLGSGPRCGLGELRLPAVQPGSSIMPGKVNPVIAESVLMVCAQVIGYDAAIVWSGAAGNFELNVMMPLMAYDLLESIELLVAASRNFAERLVEGLEADRERAGAYVEQSLAMGTALAPEIGYQKATELVKEAYRSGRTVRESRPGKERARGSASERATGSGKTKRNRVAQGHAGFAGTCGPSCVTSVLSSEL